MEQTEYSVVDTDDLVEMVLSDDRSTSREIELAQRLQLAVDMINEHDPELVPTPSVFAGGRYA